MKLYVRIPTAIGPRTIISQGMNADEASAIATALEGLGCGVHVASEGARKSLNAHMKDHQKQKKKDAEKALAKAEKEAGNVTKLPRRKKAGER